MGYRFSQEFIKKWEKRLVWTLCVGIAAAFLLAGGGVMGASAAGLEHLDSPLSWTLAGVVVLGLAIGALSVVGVVVAAAVMGGLSLHRLGWIPGLLLSLWLFGGIVLYPVAGAGRGFFLHMLGFAPIVALFFRMGRKAKVPVYLTAGTPASPRVYLSEGEGDFSGSGHAKDRDRGDTSVKDVESP